MEKNRIRINNATALGARLFILFFISQPSFATPPNVQPNTPVNAQLKNVQVNFEAIGKPSFIKIKGESTALAHKVVNEADKAYELLELELTSLNTGIDLRDEHMKEKYLRVKEHPKAVIKIVKGEKSLFDFSGKKEFSALLTLHGQTKPLTLLATKDGSQITSDFEIKLSDYGIEIPEWSGIKVADTVKVRTTFDVILEAPQLVR